MTTPSETSTSAHGDGSVTESTFRTIFEQSPVSTQIFAPSGCTIAVNPAWEALWGVTLDQIRGYNILEDPQLVAKGIMPYIRRGFAGEAVRIPAIQYTPDETIPDISSVPYRWVAASIYPIREADGGIREVVLTHEDITDQVRAEHALRESEKRLRAIFEGAPVGISVVDRDGRYVAVNPARQEMLGYTEDFLVGRYYGDLTYPEDIERDLEANAQAQASDLDGFQIEKRFVRGDGSVAWTRITVAHVRDGGEIQYSISIAEDITPRKQSEEKLRQLYAAERDARAEAQTLAAEREAILGQVAEGIIIVDASAQVIFMNEAARRITGVSTGLITVDQYDTKVRVSHLDGTAVETEELGLVRAALHGETVADQRWRIHRPDGVEAIVEGTAGPVIGDTGKLLGAVLAFRDITAQYDLERQKDDFLSAAAHDLRTPLTSIKGRVQLLRRRADQGRITPEVLGDELARIDASAGRMIALISELLDVANIQIGRPLQLTRQLTDLVALARFGASEIRQTGDAPSLVLETDVEELMGHWDPTRLERVLGNLLSNAIKYSPDGGTITIRVSEGRHHDTRMACLAVSDQGIGIPESDLPYIFDRFRRGGNVSARIAGTGIGLAAVREIVEQHGGDVSVESTEGVGTTFTVWLPLDTGGVE